MKFVNEPISVEVHIPADGAVRPIAFSWQGRRYTVADLGRTWVVEDGARRFLVMTPAQEVFELALMPDGRWMLARAPHETRLA